MAILTNKPSTITADAAAVSVTLTPATLISQMSISDAFWADSDNWFSVCFTYVDMGGSNQHKTFVFIGNQADYELPASARDGAWQCIKIVIACALGDNYTILRVDFTSASEFDFTVTGGFSESSFEWDNLSSDIATNGSGELHKTSEATGFWTYGATHTTAVEGDFTFTGTVHTKVADSTLADLLIGYKKTSAPASIDNTADNLDTVIYTRGSDDTVDVYNYAGTAVSEGAISITAEDDYVWEIQRIGSAITIKVDTVLLATDSFSGDLWLMSLIFSPASSGISIVNTTLTLD